MDKFKPFINELVKFYCLNLGNITGGNYHIVLYDGNVDDGYVWYCQQESEKNGDTFGVFLGQVLRTFTEQERDDMYENDWNWLHEY